MGLYNLDKEYEERVAGILQELSISDYDVTAIAVIFVTDDKNVICNYDNAEIPDLMLMSSYLQMIAQSRYYAMNRKNYEDEDEDFDYQSDIGLTD